jgi:hypothetical protein
MKTQKLNYVLMVITFCAVIQTSFAQESSEIARATPVAETKVENWVLLGSHVVDFTIDRDVISLDESATPYTSLKFNVKGGPINLHKCTVHFEAGESQDINFAASEGSEQVIDLKGNSRNITKITFWYDTKGSSEEKATVEVFGKK